MPVLVIAVGGILLHVMVALKSKLLLKEALRARAIVQARRSRGCELSSKATSLLDHSRLRPLRS